MAKLTEADVDRIAALAHLELTADERTRLARELARVLAYAERIQAIDTDAVPPTAHATFEGTRFREDEPRPGLDRERVLGLAPEAGEGLFKVPKVLP